MVKKVLLRSILVLALACSAVVVQGCWAVAAGAAGGTVAYVMGDLEAARSESLDEVYSATISAMEDLEYKVTSKQKDALEAEVAARSAADKKVTVYMERTGEGTTRISVRVGVFGSEEKSRLIYDEIVANL